MYVLIHLGNINNSEREYKGREKVLANERASVKLTANVKASAEKSMCSLCGGTLWDFVQVFHESRNS